MYLKERRICTQCGKYYDEQRYERRYKDFTFRKSYLFHQCTNCGCTELMLEIKVEDETTQEREENT